jgi:hypothetical protein
MISCCPGSRPDDSRYELIAVLIARQLAGVAAAAQARIAAAPDLHMRAILVARLQIALDGALR